LTRHPLGCLVSVHEIANLLETDPLPPPQFPNLRIILEFVMSQKLSNYQYKLIIISCDWQSRRNNIHYWIRVICLVCAKKYLQNGQDCKISSVKTEDFDV